MMPGFVLSLSKYELEVFVLVLFVLSMTWVAFRGRTGEIAGGLKISFAGFRLSRCPGQEDASDVAFVWTGNFSWSMEVPVSPFSFSTILVMPNSSQQCNSKTRPVPRVWGTSTADCEIAIEDLFRIKDVCRLATIFSPRQRCWHSGNRDLLLFKAAKRKAARETFRGTSFDPIYLPVWVVLPRLEHRCRASTMFHEDGRPRGIIPCTGEPLEKHSVSHFRS